MLNAFLADVQRLATEATPRLLADLLSSAVPSRYCEKCRVKLGEYVRLKLLAYHAKKRSWRWLHQSASLTGNVSKLEMDAKIESARSAFYETECLCGKRTEYMPK